MAVLDRYIAVAYPFRYLDIVNYRVVTLATICTHVYVACLSFVSLIPGANQWGSAGTNCTFNLVLTRAHIYTLLINMLLFMAVSLSTSARVLTIARQHRRKIAGAAMTTYVEASQSHLQYHRDQSSTDGAAAMTSSQPKQHSTPHPRESTSGIAEESSGEHQGNDQESVPETHATHTGDFLDYSNDNCQGNQTEAGRESNAFPCNSNDGKAMQDLQPGRNTPAAHELNGQDITSQHSGLFSRNTNRLCDGSQTDLTEASAQRTVSPHGTLHVGDQVNIPGGCSRSEAGPISSRQNPSSPITDSLLWLTSKASLIHQNAYVYEDCEPTKGISTNSPKSKTFQVSFLKRKCSQAKPFGSGSINQGFFPDEIGSSTDSCKSQPRDSSSSRHTGGKNGKVKEPTADSSSPLDLLRQLPQSPLPLAVVPEAHDLKSALPRSSWILGSEAGGRPGFSGHKSSVSGVWIGQLTGDGGARQSPERKAVVFNTHAESARTKKYKLRQSGLANLLFCCCWFPYVVVQFYMLENPRVNLMPNNVASFFCMWTKMNLMQTNVASFFCMTSGQGESHVRQFCPVLLYGKWHKMNLMPTNVASFFCMLNAILNPFIYVLGNTRMRRNMLNCLRGQDQSLLEKVKVKVSWKRSKSKSPGNVQGQCFLGKIKAVIYW
ncbi:hypothetical protein EGW08_020717 [Elysia chlorotica]|uniref:Uncharacterized protein n=1 Tax=Elysia chlorotica TaxID=188477 RepID=A0A3S1AYD9_ELYCH|nr:hypothetical protein EGW08_020717 [Elysia chlorotica]